MFFIQIYQGHGFIVTPRNALSQIQKISRPSAPSDAATFVAHTSLLMAPKNQKDDSKKGTNEVEWGEIVGMLVNPLNPYAWFVYFFVGIYVYGSIGGQ